MTNEDYLSKFHHPKITAYDFLCLLISILRLNEVESFERDSVENWIVHCKNSNLYHDLLEDIHLKSNGVQTYSEELQNAYFVLKVARVLYTISPEKDSEIFILINLFLIMEEISLSIRLKPDKS